MLVEPIKLYIDPGTGSMLFAILIGIIGALGYIKRALLSFCYQIGNLKV